MNESQFNDLADELMLVIEEAIDASGADIDYETSAGVMTLTIEADGSKVIISRQPAMTQIWVAARSGGYHFNFSDGQWCCSTTAETLPELLSRACSEQSGEALLLNF
ncbi:iron donor protein CyaY [Porticoccus sp.]